MKLLDKIIKYESGEMSPDEKVEFFQYLIDEGLLPQLQGAYQREANQLINFGYCHLKGK